MIYGYARVSTGGQSLAGQLDALGLEASRIFAEKVSGAESNRPQLKRLLRSVKEGDVVVVTRLDRMARSTRDLLNILAELEYKKACFRSLGDPWANTTTPQGRLIVTIMGGMAEFERELIRVRTTEGRARAVAAGVKLGRRPKLTLAQRQIALVRRAAGEKHQVIASAYNVSCSTISRLKPMDATG